MSDLEDRRRRRVIDPTITVGNILTAVGFALAGFGAWSTLDKRVAAVEIQQQAQRDTDNRQDRNATETKAEIKETLREINQKLDRLIENRAGARRPNGETP